MKHGLEQALDTILHEFIRYFSGRENEPHLIWLNKVHEAFQQVIYLHQEKTVKAFATPLRELIFEKHGMRLIGFWTAVIGTSGTLYYMLASESLAQREKAWAAFASDPEWIKARAETEREGPLIRQVRNMILRPTPYSPLK